MQTIRRPTEVVPTRAFIGMTDKAVQCMNMIVIRRQLSNRDQVRCVMRIDYISTDREFNTLGNRVAKFVRPPTDVAFIGRFDRR